jgi:glycerophosphoryl diester phosphodiesterase
MKLGLIFLLFSVSALAESGVLPPPNQGGVYVIAHRGAHHGVPENTLAAYRKAIALGADFVEVDLRATKDQQIVSVHNRDIDAYTQGAKGNVADMTLAELKALDIGSRVAPAWKTERIPAWDEIIQLCQGKIGFYIDLKAAPVAHVLDGLKQYDMQTRAAWYADFKELDELRRICPEAIPMPDPAPNAPAAPLVERLNPPVVAPTWKKLSADYVQRWHAAGVLVFVDEDWSDAHASWEKALAWGADGIQTNQPAALIAYLRARDAQKD